MRILYIDDSFFQPTLFAQTLLERLQAQMERLAPSAVLISAQKTNELIEAFVKEVSPKRSVLLSPCTFHIDDMQGILRDDALLIEGQRMVFGSEGAFFCYDSETQSLERIYLLLFAKRDEEVLREIARQIEEIFKNKFAVKKHILH